jgi:hypothetical protein
MNQSSCPQSGNWLRFRFVFVSCVRASGRCEAVWAFERGMFVNAGPRHGEKSDSGPAVALAFLMLYARFFGFVHINRCYLCGFFGGCFVFLMLCAWAF